MKLPPLAPLPPASIRISIAPQEWEACLDAWLTLAIVHLRQPRQEFSANVGKAFSDFIPNFYHELTHQTPEDRTLSGEQVQHLRRVCFTIVDRATCESKPPPWTLTWEFLSDFCRVHFRSPALSKIMQCLWKWAQTTLESIMHDHKVRLTKLLDSSNSDAACAELVQLAPLLRASSDVSAFFMTGSDFLDALASAYFKTTDAERRKPLVSTVYIGFASLVRAETPNVSALSDALYGLKAEADEQPNAPSLLADLVTNTPMVSQLKIVSSGKGVERLTKVLETVETYHMPSIARHRRHPKSKSRVSKGKGKASHNDTELHVHRTSLVTQIQDLFPDLGSRFILRLLDEYEENVEQVTAHLLDGSLPPHLQGLDQSEQSPSLHETPQEKIDHLAPRSTPEPFVPERRNIFDDDELLTADASRLHIGKKPDRADSSQPNKSAILSALAAFDSDDDERDDTYDVEDVGGTVDTAHPDGEPGPSARVTQEENDMVLFAAYKSSPDLFGRTFDTRRGQARSGLKAETGMTDEAIEGWAIMLQRDPRRLQRLERQFGLNAHDGNQPELAGSAYRGNAGGTETEDSDVPTGPTDRGGFRGRGGRGLGRGRGGNVAGPAGDAATVAAQRRKEANKGSRANHNRRDQRARKMARGGFPG